MTTQSLPAAEPTRLSETVIPHQVGDVVSTINALPPTATSLRRLLEAYREHLEAAIDAEQDGATLYPVDLLRMPLFAFDAPAGDVER